MGLSVTHGIVNRYGGQIDFDSEPGKGTIFQEAECHEGFSNADSKNS